MPSDCDALLQMAQAMQYLYGRKILINFAPNSILICNQQGNVCLKLGHPEYWGSQAQRRLLSHQYDVNYQNWVAPEYPEIPEFTIVYTGNIWQLGCLFFYLIRRGEHPFGDTFEVIHHKKMKGEPVNLNSKIKHFKLFITITKQLKQCCKTTELTKSPTIDWKLLLIAKMIKRDRNERVELDYVIETIEECRDQTDPVNNELKEMEFSFNRRWQGIMGCGSNGPVYWGRFYGTKVAVKASSEWEEKVLVRLNHGGIVRLLYAQDGVNKRYVTPCSISISRIRV